MCTEFYTLNNVDNFVTLFVSFILFYILSPYILPLHNTHRLVAKFDVVVSVCYVCVCAMHVKWFDFCRYTVPFFIREFGTKVTS